MKPNWIVEVSDRNGKISSMGDEVGEALPTEAVAVTYLASLRFPEGTTGKVRPLWSRADMLEILHTFEERLMRAKKKEESTNTITPIKPE